jgi:succinyl-CoA synthetase beta subunit
MDRTYNGPVIIASSEGGVEIETVASENPSAIVKEPIDIMDGLLNEQTERVAKAIGFPATKIREVRYSTTLIDPELLSLILLWCLY